jgi:hypothetical protein
VDINPVIARLTTMAGNSWQLKTQTLPEGCSSLQKHIMAVYRRRYNFTLEWATWSAILSVSLYSHR